MWTFRAALLLLSAALALALVLRTRARTISTAFAAASNHTADERPPALWDVPPFAFANSNGQVVNNSTLRGHVWIADFIFTRCTTMCPIITAKMALLRRAIASAGIRFVSFSIDPAYDTPSVLLAYAAQWSPDPRWLLLSPGPTQVTEFAQAMKVPFEHSIDPVEPILHTTLFFLVDRRGRVRGIYGSLDDKAVLRLQADVAALDANTDSLSAGGTNPNPAPNQVPGSSRGLALSRALGCRGCHDQPKTAPSLAGLAGRTVHLEGGVTVVADDAYLRRSIVAPDEQVVSGYNPLMPTYKGYLTQNELNDLVDYLHSAAETEVAANPEGPPVESDLEAQDPVCGMKIKQVRAAATTNYRAKTYYFCSELCRSRFLKAPTRYANPAAPDTERSKAPG